MELDAPVQYLRGVGPKLAGRFARLGIGTVGQLLAHYPRRYIDYTHPYALAEAPFDTDCVVEAEVYSKSGPTRLAGGRTMHRALAGDGNALLSVTWFNNPYAASRLRIGGRYFFEGRVGGSLTRRELVNPVQRTPAEVRVRPLVAVYPQTEGLGSGQIARAVAAALEGLAVPLPETLPPALLARYRLPGRMEAVRAIHCPASAEEAGEARRRLVFEELLCLQLGLLLLRGQRRRTAGAPMHAAPLETFWAALPFAPTGAQRRAVGEITAAMAGETPMNRLLQGDVGSGKTLVAAAGIYMAAQNGYQSALMAPTEILARQHAENLQNLLGPFGVRVALLTGGMRAAARRSAYAAIAAGEADLVVGTHAVITSAVRFARLGLAVVDEQHRFGVRQRGLLAGKAGAPHLLVMSATPIPRTLGLLLYGDLDFSLLDELPPGRKPVRTRAVPGERRRDMYGFLEKQIAAGHRVYVVCPRVGQDGEDMPGPDDPGAVNAVRSYYKEVACALLPGRRVGLLHGRMKPAEKQAAMRDFKAGTLDVLVSTTVIEVGVDVPEATVMVIENAERYGLSALHQLRGRVGRGAAESWCFLVSDHPGEGVKERLRFLCSTSDGFEIAKYDLEHRGPGDFFGERQHGLPTLRLANLVADTHALEQARHAAQSLLQDDPQLGKPEHAALAGEVEALFERAGALN